MEAEKLKKIYGEEMINFSDSIRYSNLVSEMFSKMADKFELYFNIYTNTWDRALYIYPWMGDKKGASYQKENNIANLFEDSFEINPQFKLNEELYDALDGFYLLAKELKDRGEGIKKRLNQTSSKKKYYELIKQESMLTLNRPSLLKLLKSEFQHGELYDKNNFKLHLDNFDKKVLKSIESFFETRSEEVNEKYKPLMEKIHDREKKARDWWDNYQKMRFDNYVNHLSKEK
jgi:hypothetical protein